MSILSDLNVHKHKKYNKNIQIFLIIVTFFHCGFHHLGNECVSSDIFGIISCNF